MIFLFNFYLILYIINLISLIYLIKSTFNGKISLTSLPYIVYYIVNFSKIKYLYYGLTVALTGLPPFILFFIKFNYLIATWGRGGFILSYVAFLVLFINMIYYLQPIYLKNIEFNWEYINITKKKPNIKVIYIIHFFLTMFYLSVFFFPDLLLIANNSLV